MPSSVQHGNTSPSATSPAPFSSIAGQLEFGHERRTGRTLADHLAPHTVQSHCGPAGLEARHDAGRAGVGDHDQTVDVEVDRSGQPLGDRVRQGPVAGAAAQRRGGLESVGVGAGIELPCAELGKHWTRQRLADVGFGLGLLHQLVAACGLERPKRLSAILFGVLAEIENHLAASRARDSRMRCISMLPDDTVEACEYRQWSSTSPRNHFARGSSCDTSAAMSISTSALSWSSLVTAIRYAAASPGWMRPLLCRSTHAIRHQAGAAAVRQHANPPSPQLRGQVVPAVAEHGRCGGKQPFAAGVPGDADPLERHHVLHDRPARVDGAEHVGLGDPQVVEEHLVEVVRTHHAADGPHLDRRIIHRHKEDRQALLLFLLHLLPLGGAGEQEAPLRHGGVGRPDLLTADQPAVAVAPRGRAQRREVGTRLRFGEALTPDHLAARDRRQVLALLLLGAVAHDDGPDPVDPHVLGAARLVVRPHLFADHRLFPHRRPAATELLRPRQAQQVAFGQGPAELLGGLEVGGVVGERTQKVLGHMGFHQFAQLTAQLRGFLPHLEVHGSIPIP